MLYYAYNKRMRIYIVYKKITTNKKFVSGKIIFVLNLLINFFAVNFITHTGESRFGRA